MSHKHPTSVSFTCAVKLCVLAICHPSKFAALESADNAVLDATTDAPHIANVLQIRNALKNSLFLVLAATAFGLFFGCILRCAYGSAGTNTVAVLQAVGALILLWATLAVRGWDILTNCAVTYSERVNQWIYRFLYCLGTSIVVCSLVWQVPTAS
jgi:hypothetical protein